MAQWSKWACGHVKKLEKLHSDICRWQQKHGFFPSASVFHLLSDHHQPWKHSSAPGAHLVLSAACIGVASIIAVFLSKRFYWLRERRFTISQSRHLSSQEDWAMLVFFQWQLTSNWLCRISHKCPLPLLYTAVFSAVAFSLDLPRRRFWYSLSAHEAKVLY